VKVIVFGSKGSRPRLLETEAAQQSALHCGELGKGFERPRSSSGRRAAVHQAQLPRWASRRFWDPFRRALTLARRPRPKIGGLAGSVTRMPRPNSGRRASQVRHRRRGAVLGALGSGGIGREQGGGVAGARKAAAGPALLASGPSSKGTGIGPRRSYGQAAGRQNNSLPGAGMNSSPGFHMSARAAGHTQVVGQKAAWTSRPQIRTSLGCCTQFPCQNRDENTSFKAVF